MSEIIDETISRLNEEFKKIKEDLEESKIIESAVRKLTSIKDALIKEIEGYRSLKLPSETLELLQSGIKIFPIDVLIDHRGENSEYHSLHLEYERFQLATSNKVSAYAPRLDKLHTTQIYIPNKICRVYLVLKPATVEEIRTFGKYPEG